MQAAGGFSFVELYTPKLVTVLRERYGLRDLKSDAIAGLTVAIVALPLSMAIAIASGVTPDRGLYTAIIGGICVTGTIARTATNVRAGARGPVSGMLHALFLLLFMLIAAPLAGYIPLAALAGLLGIVAWNMAEKHAFGVLLRASRGDAVVLLATFLLVILRDLTTGILVGFGLGALLFLHRLAQAVSVEAEADVPDRMAGADRAPYDPALATNRDVAVYRISGAFFFGAAASVAAALDRIGQHPKVHVIDFSAVPVIDSTAVATIDGFVRKTERNGAKVIISGAAPSVERALTLHGLRPPRVDYRASVTDAVNAIRRPKG